MFLKVGISLAIQKDGVVMNMDKNGWKNGLNRSQERKQMVGKDFFYVMVMTVISQLNLFVIVSIITSK